jgi:hypothetical protein
VTTTCGCGTVLKESYPAAINRHNDTKRHQEWLAAKYADETASTPDPAEVVKWAPAQQNDETASEYLSRLEFVLGTTYDTFTATDEGQKVLAEAASEAAEARKAAAKAELKEKIQQAKERAAQASLQRQNGPVEIVQPPTNGKPTKAARAAGVKPPKEFVEAVKSGSPEPILKALKGGKLEIAGTKIVKASGGNKPLKLGDPITVGNLTYRAILHRDGSVAKHQTDNYIWKCPMCSRRLRDERCVGPKGGTAHQSVNAPTGYRAADRIVR